MLQRYLLTIGHEKKGGRKTENSSATTCVLQFPDGETKSEGKRANHFQSQNSTRRGDRAVVSKLSLMISDVAGRVEKKHEPKNESRFSKLLHTDLANFAPVCGKKSSQ